MSSPLQLVPQNPRNQNCTGLVCDNEEKTREISLAVFQEEENKRASSFTHVFLLLIREQRFPAIFCAPVGRTVWSRERGRERVLLRWVTVHGPRVEWQPPLLRALASPPCGWRVYLSSQPWEVNHRAMGWGGVFYPKEIGYDMHLLLKILP